MMELKDTIEMMVSDDYKERFKAEYFQLAIRYTKLLQMVNAWDNNELDFTPTCSREVYATQLSAMKEQLKILAYRADVEGILLNYDETSGLATQSIKYRMHDIGYKVSSDLREKLDSYRHFSNPNSPLFSRTACSLDVGYNLPELKPGVKYNLLKAGVELYGDDHKTIFRIPLHEFTSLIYRESLDIILTAIERDRG